MNYLFIPEYVKKIGRTLFEQDILWCGLSGSGAAFYASGTKVVVTIVGDDTTSGNLTEGQARVAIFVDGVRTLDTMIDAPEKNLELWNGQTSRKALIEIVKLSECPMSTCGLKEITIEGEAASVEPAPSKECKIEFIGDSITCGYGIDREDPETCFETATEDVTRAYAYKVAKNLNAEYSMVSYSGYGIISGYTDTDQKVENQLLPLYYEKVGFSYGKPFGTLQLSDCSWDFRNYQPQLVVVNLGTNDDSYCQDDESRQQDYIEHYVEFLKTVRRNNPQAQILCTVGTMCERIGVPTNQAVLQYSKETNDSQICFYQLPLQLPEDGLVSDYHPTEISHNKAATLLTEKISQLMGWDSVSSS